MDKRKNEKIAALVVGVGLILLSFVGISNIQSIAICSGCGLIPRLLYPFFHVNLLHVLLNVWCLLSLVFMYDITWRRLLVSYLVAATIPVDTLGTFLSSMNTPTIGLSGIVYFLFATISFEVVRKYYYQSWMVFYLIVGFFFPNMNAWLHLYCYVAGLIYALLNKPIKVQRHSD